MAALQKGLGRGLGALFQDDAPEAKESENKQHLPLGSLVPNPRQPRRDFDDEALSGLADSIKTQGVLQPVLVRPVAGSKPPRYEIVAGERRWRASKLAGLIEVPVVIRELSDQETLAVALIENLQREDLNPMEEALGISELKEEFGLSQEELSKTLGKSRSAIANILRLLNLSQSARGALASGAISSGHARAILALSSAAEQEILLTEIIEKSLTVREAEGWAAGKKAENPDANEKIAPDNLLAKMSPPPSKAKRLPQSAVLLELQTRLSKSVGLPVRLSGGEKRGKLSISYSSREELAALLEKIGIAEEC
jgi:ParB family chromosome partitioning protein